MSPKQEKFLIAKFHELTLEIKRLTNNLSEVELFLNKRAGYNPPPKQVAPPIGGAPVAGAVVAPA